MGSPETRKGKKRNKSPNKNESQSPEKKQGASPTKKPIAASQVEAQIAPDRKDKQLPKEAAEPRPQGFSEAKSTAAVETTIKVAEESKKPDGKSTGETKFKVPEVPASPTKPAPQLKGDTKAAEDQPGPKLDVAEKDAIRKQSEPKQASVTKQKAPETQPGPKVDVAKVVITKQSEPKQKTATEQKAQEAQQGPKLDAAKDNIPKQPEHTQKSATKLKVPISAKDTHGDAKAPALKETEKPVDPKSEIEPKVKVTESVDAAKTKAPQPKDDVKPAAPVSDKKAQLPATKPSTQSKAKPVETKTEAKAEVSLPKSNAKVVLPIEKPIGKPETSVQAPGDRSGDIKGTPGPVATATKEKIVQREASPVAVGPSATATSKDPNAVQKQPAEAGTDAPPTLPQEDAGSDEDQKNETSFHSAKEAQSDSGNEEPVGSSGKLSVQPAQLPENRAVTGAKQDMSKDALGPAKAGGQSDSALAKPSSSVDKKPGAKQTEAIYPFAKSKAKQKAEKARQKKEKKKEKEKAKNEKLAPASKSNKSVDKSVDATPTGTPPLSPSTKSTETSRGQDKDETQDGESKHDGGKDNAPLAAPVGVFHRMAPKGSPIEKTKQEVPPRPQDGGVTSYETELVTANGETVPSAETDGAESSHPSATAQSTESTAIAGAEQPGIINEEVAHPKGRLLI